MCIYINIDMDIAQIFGDYIHLLGMIILLVKLWLTKNCAGISGKTQLLYAMVFTARYTDLTIRYAMVYNTILKIVYISITYCTVLSIFVFFRKTYDRKHDAFRIELLILPCAVFALFMNNGFESIEVFWSFSTYLEAVAIVPQVYLVSKSKQVESVVISYISCLGLYRGCYLMHWLYAYFKLGRLERIAVASGIVQLIFYCDFFARNLPILKPKDCPPPDHYIDGAVVAREQSCGDKSLCDSPAKVVVDPETALIQTSRIVQPAMVHLPMPDTLTTEEKVTLLAAKEQGTSN